MPKTPDLEKQLSEIAAKLSELGRKPSLHERSKEFRKLSRDKNAIIAALERSTKQ